MANVKLLVAGAAGKMGRAVIKEALSTPGVSIAGGFERPGHEAVGKDLGPLAGLDSLGVAIEAGPEKQIARADALIDFTAPAASLSNARLAAEAGVPHIIGTTGFAAEQEEEIAALARRAAIVKSGNMSLGVNLLAALAREAAQRLGPDYDIEIVEAHHRAKIDAPSGTALLLGRAVADGRGVALEDNEIRARDGAVGARPQGAIGFAVIRGGGIIGDHDVMFAGAEETLTLSHRAIDRGLFAKGAVAAAKWAIGKPPGLYSMADVLGFSR
ncbi:MAG TPA: 4-hydroxy-tetrahydrodipicolinate reductase [Parvularculaceae bacterium]|nr:4-hydroxy-tetrahydrodipicolinate reductase [Parvularculaceae bacterium]